MNICGIGVRFELNLCFQFKIWFQLYCRNASRGQRLCIGPSLVAHGAGAESDFCIRGYEQSKLKIARCSSGGPSATSRSWRETQVRTNWPSDNRAPIQKLQLLSVRSGLRC